MVASEQKRDAREGKPHSLKNLTHFKISNPEQSRVLRETLLYISILKLKIEALQRGYEDFKIIKTEPLNHSQEVKVERIGEKFQVKIKGLKGENKLVNILQAFEEMGLSVNQARASCRDSFAMEAILVAQSSDKMWNVEDMTQTLVQALVKPSGLQ